MKYIDLEINLNEEVKSRPCYPTQGNSFHSGKFLLFRGKWQDTNIDERMVLFMVNLDQHCQISQTVSDLL